MSSDGRRIILSIIAVPVLAAIGAFILFQSEAESISSTVGFVFGTNLLPMLIGGFFSGLLIRAVNRSGGTATNKRWIALAPVAVLLIFGILWYLLALINLGSFDAGRQYFSGPIYLLGLALGVGILASIVYAVMPKSAA